MRCLCHESHCGMPPKRGLELSIQEGITILLATRSLKENRKVEWDSQKQIIS